MENQKFTIMRDGYYLCGLESFRYGTRFHGHFVTDPSRSLPLTFLQASSLCDELGKFEVLPFPAPSQEVTE